MSSSTATQLDDFDTCLRWVIVEWIVEVPKGTEIALIATQSRSGIVRAVVSCE